MNSRLLFLGFGFLMIAGIALVVSVGLKPRPVPKIKLSAFENEQVVANAIKLRFWQELRGASHVFWGFDPSNTLQVRVLESLIPIVKSNELGPFTVLAQKDFLAENVGKSLGVEFLMDFSRGDAGLAGQLNPKGFQNKIEDSRFFILVPLNYATQSIEKSPARLLMSTPDYKVLSLIATWLPRKRDEESQFPVPCETVPKSEDSLGRIGCLMLQSARTSYRKKMEGPIVGIADQTGSSEYSLMLR